MTNPEVILRLEGHHLEYRPGEVLSGEYRLLGVHAGEIEAVEISVVWHTAGKGDEDLAVHFFKRLTSSEPDPLDPAVPVRFSTLLPNSPLSYEGVIVKIRWSARVRVFLHRGRELFAEQRFQLGHVPAARAVLP